MHENSGLFTKEAVQSLSRCDKTLEDAAVYKPSAFFKRTAHITHKSTGAISRERQPQRQGAYPPCFGDEALSFRRFPHDQVSNSICFIINDIFTLQTLGIEHASADRDSK